MYIYLTCYGQSSILNMYIYVYIIMPVNRGNRRTKLRYMSFFSGIGGFELAIHKLFPQAECIGYSEIKPSAIRVYEHHFPNHLNLGDITTISNRDLKQIADKGCDLIVAGFPCTNLSSLATISGNSDGVEGPKSGLFHDLIRIIKAVCPAHFVIENNSSMTQEQRKIIYEVLSKLTSQCHTTVVDASRFGVQHRRRVFWTSFPIKEELPKEGSKSVQQWSEVLEPVKAVKMLGISQSMIDCLNKPFNDKKSKEGAILATDKKTGKHKFIKIENHHSKWGKGMISDTTPTGKECTFTYPVGKSRPITGTTGGTNNLVIDRRCSRSKGDFVRYFSPLECERLFHMPDGYTLPAQYRTTRISLLGNSVVVAVVEYVLRNLKNM